MSDDEKGSVVDGNYSLWHDNPEDMTLAGIVDEMIRIAIKNLRVLEDYFYMKDSTPGERYRILKHELISRE
jgi:hypothetical protein